MGFLVKLALKIAINAAILYFAGYFFTGFIFPKDAGSIAIGASVLTILSVFLRPLLRLISLPLIWLTLGLFNVVIHVAILLIADSLLSQMIIADFWTLLWMSVIIALANRII